MDNDAQNKALSSIYGVSFDKQAPIAALFQATLKKDTDEWSEQGEEGQLAVDIFDTEKDIFVVSTVAGASEEDLEIVIHNDMMTIRGSRKSPIKVLADHSPILEFFHKECFWGRFSRTIVLPHEVKNEFTSATLQNGVLVVRLPKREQSARIPITVIEE